MSAIYNARIIGKLSALSDKLRSLGFGRESNDINNIIGKINSWKEGKEWNPDNSLGLTDADHVLEDLVNKFKVSVLSFQREKDKIKDSKEEPIPQTEQDTESETKSEQDISKMINDLEITLENLF